ncbi:product [Rubellimicrobium thermophilum DSM 16684]|uniref:Product n=1 Tax=Rubellimicrobium thermophilum DSM 16684 TaxID=1123069 RepID=S9RYM2_9RHOB|nr:SDR family oxidoreductase [Rubellimicrobium thermophilum]EPX83085.1 product [Rubellimicrobium thermophilum DSM 16684]
MTTRVALLTAAGSGIGAAAARELAARGWRVALLSPSGRAERLAAELGGIGITGSYESGEDVVRLRDAALSGWGRIDALVCSAGHGPRGGVLDLPDADWHRALEVYFLSAMRPIRLVAPQMGEGGSIVAVTSYAAQQPAALYPTSSAMRAGLHAALKLVADELGPRGIRVNAVLPGFIDSIPQPPERYAGAALGRQGRVEEAARAIAFLCSEDASYVTGTTLRVDGGLARMP